MTTTDDSEHFHLYGPPYQAATLLGPASWVADCQREGCDARHILSDTEIAAHTARQAWDDRPASPPPWPDVAGEVSA